MIRLTNIFRRSLSVSEHVGHEERQASPGVRSAQLPVGLLDLVYFDQCNTDSVVLAAHKRGVITWHQERENG